MTQNFGVPTSIQNYGIPVSGTANLVATGHDQASAFLLSTQEGVFTDVPPGSGVRLPAPFNYSITIYNLSDNDLLIYPASGDRFFRMPINAPVTLGSGASRVFVSFDTPLTVRPCVWYQQLPTGAGTVTSVDGSGGSTGLTVSGGPVTAAGTLTLGGILNVAHGGTGLGAAGVSGGVLSYIADDTLASSALLAENQIVLGGGAGATPATLGSLGTSTTVLHGNAGGLPGFGAVDLATDVTGRLPFANLATLAASRLFGNAGTVAADGSGIPIGTGLSFSSGTLIGQAAGSAAGVLSGTYPNPGFATIAASSILANGGTVGGAPTAVPIGSGLTFAAGTLSAASGGIPLTVGDGGTSVANVGSILISGGTISGSAGNATLTISGASGVTSVVIDAAPFLNAGTVTTTGTITAATLASQRLLGNAAGTAAVPGAIAIGTGLSLSVGGTLSATGASVVQQATLALSSADILALNTTPLTVAAAPGAGKWLKPISLTFNITHGTTLFSGGTSANLYYTNSSGSSVGSAVTTAFTAGTPSSPKIQYFPLNTSATLATPSAVDNAPLVMSAVSAFTAGNGSAVVVLDYVTLPTP